MEQTAQERTVHRIPASRSNVAGNKTRLHGRQRVAAYCRVSTDSEEQINSYAAQKAYYTQKIEESPDWELAGIFADEGITGTSMKKRKEFRKTAERNVWKIRQDLRRSRRISTDSIICRRQTSKLFLITIDSFILRRVILCQLIYQKDRK